ncbi:MAG TPA: malto-oligosyltrehalose trehalohydrolase [Elainellaceae cyanobacterium]
MQIGATYLGHGQCEFTVWAPQLQKVAVEIVAPDPKIVSLEPAERGYWTTTIGGLSADTQYRYQLDETSSYPDPASQWQPDGVHGASQVVDHHAFSWTDGNWKGIPLEELIVYELHVGTFTPDGTFEAIANRLDDLKDLGVNAIEIMPVSAFPGDRNWGYDAAYPYAVQHSYGGPNGLKNLVNQCHEAGFAVILDVIYNHFGPEGNYTSQFAPYFTGRYSTPWGKAINFDDAHSDGVRNFVIENVLYWFDQFHMDGLRLDAIHAIFDFGAKPILAEISERVAELDTRLGRKHLLIAESDLNDVRVVQPRDQNGYGMHAQWSDDFHHSLHVLLTGEKTGYYEDFGTCAQFAKAFEKSFVYTWDYSTYRKRTHGSDVSDRSPSQFVVFAQNHDQVGNRMLGERLSKLVSFESLKLAAGALMFAPAVPLMFMGEEYGEEAPFQYFISHTDPDLVEAVRQGRKDEFRAFHAQGEPPDAQSIETFQRCVLNWDQRKQGNHGILRQFYQRLIELRRKLAPLTHFNRSCVDTSVSETDKLVAFRRWKGDEEVLGILNFGSHAVTWTDLQSWGTWHKQIDSADQRWLGPGFTLPDTLTLNDSPTIQPYSIALYALAKR